MNSTLNWLGTTSSLQESAEKRHLQVAVGKVHCRRKPMQVKYLPTSKGIEVSYSCTATLEDAEYCRGRKLSCFMKTLPSCFWLEGKKVHNFVRNSSPMTDADLMPVLA